MMTSTARGFAKTKAGMWTSWGAIALTALAAGVILPQVFPGETVLPAASIPESVDKGDLSYKAPTLPNVSSPQPMLIRLVAGTVVVLVLCVGSLWGMRGWLAPNQNNLGGVRTMRLAETLALGNRCSLHLVQFGKNQVLVGTDGGGIKTIVPLPEGFDEILDEAAKTDDGA